MTEPLLAVVDGNNFCLRNIGGAGFRTGSGEILQTSYGVPTNMLLGSINYLNSLHRRLDFTHLIFTFDSGRSSYRLAIRPEYKSNRKDSTFSFDPKPQFAMFQEFLDLIGVPWVQERNVEADDLIASITLAAEGFPTVVVSADHDLLQLVSDTVSVYRPSIGKTPEVMYTPEKVLEKYGLPPEKLPEMWALMGDTGDGIKGIDKVGPKTATKLIQEFRHVEYVLDTPKYAEHSKLVFDNLEMIRLDPVRHLSDIPEDINLTFDPRSTPELRAFLERYELSSLVWKLDHNSLWD